MISKKTWIIICLILAITYHFIFYFGSYGPSFNNSIFNYKAILPLASVLILIFVYIGTNWRSDLKDNFIIKIFDLMILWIFICFFRSVLNINGTSKLQELLFTPYRGLSLFPTLFFLVGINLKYFSPYNMILSIYLVLTCVFSFFYRNYVDLPIFLLMPIFYIIIMFPLQSNRNRILTLIISISLIVISLTNRAGVMRIIISYLIVIIYYVILKIKINKKLINVIVFFILISPLYLIYLGINGKSIFKSLSGEDKEEYSQEDLKADTRTLLYIDVFQDLKINKAFIFGKGINAGYASYGFDTLNRPMVEVGFLQILFKSGIVGFLLYMTLIISAIFKALTKSKNLFMKFLGLLLSGYVLMFFIENVLTFDLLNVIIWFVVGMCHSDGLRGLNDEEIKNLNRMFGSYKFQYN